MDKEFYNVVSLDEFFKCFDEFSPVQDTQRLHITDISLPSILAHNLYAPEDLPHFSRSTMDGYAVMAQDTFGASESNPVYLELVKKLSVDSYPDFQLLPGQCAQVVTGSAVPQGADGVVMIEYTKQLNQTEIEIVKSIAPGTNIITKGDDCKKGELILTRGTKLNYSSVGLLAGLGIDAITVFKHLRVALIITGNELVHYTESPRIGQIRDVNSLTVCHFLRQNNCQVVNYGLVTDEKQAITEVVRQALSECDLILISGGSSVGQKDYTLQVINKLPGSKIYIHGVALRPGKPTIMAKVGQKPIIGLPGQVASAMVVMHILVKPFIDFLSGDRNWAQRADYYVQAVLRTNVPSKPGREEIIGVQLSNTAQDELPQAIPLFAKSGLLKGISAAHGYIRIPAHLEGLTKGEYVKVYPLN